MMAKEKLVLVKTEEQLAELIEYIKSADYLAFDTETNGVDKDSKIIGFSVSADIDSGYYVTTAYWDKEAKKLVCTDFSDLAKDIISLLVGKHLIMHNALFDCAMVNNNYGVELMPYVHTDTMILAHILDENRSCALKELGVYYFGDTAKDEKKLVDASVAANGGQLTKKCYELYKADPALLGYYGAKDTLLTMKLFYQMLPELYDQGLEDFFYKHESMPLLRGPTYDLNTAGLKVDPERLQNLKSKLEAECMEARAYIYQEIEPAVAEKYVNKKGENTFKITASGQLSWLLFDKLGNPFNTLTKEGKNVCKAMGLRIPYNLRDKREFVSTIIANKGQVYAPAKFNPKTKKMGQTKKVRDYWYYTQCGKETLGTFAKKYKWIDKLLEYSGNMKILKTYVIGIQEKIQYGIIRPSFLQHGTTSGRYSSNKPNFQNLPKKDTRVKNCIIARPGKILVGADQSQVEVRVFAAISKDPVLMASFERGEDFYSVLGASVYDKEGYSLFKNEKGGFADKFPGLRDQSKVFGLATPYGRQAGFQAAAMKISRDEAQSLIDKYFEKYPSVELMMLNAHETAKKDGVVYSIFGRPRRIPEAKLITQKYGNLSHKDLPYEARNILNLAVNHPIQSTAATIMNRAAIAIYAEVQLRAREDARWREVKIVLQVHDELILEGPIALREAMEALLKEKMETTTTLPGVKLEAIPKSGYSLAELK